MSRLSELLKSQQTSANVANPANKGGRHGKVSQLSQDSQGGNGKTQLSPSLESRLREMAKYWRYAPDDLEDVLSRAAKDPEAWLRAVIADEHLRSIAVEVNQ